MTQPNRRERRATALREAVLSAAERELRTHGAAGFAVERVAAAADVAVQTVYNHFNGRDGLLLAVAERALHHDRSHMDAGYEASGSPSERLTAAALAYARFAQQHPESFRLLAFPPGPAYDPAAASGRSREIAERVAAAVQAQNARLAAALSDGIRAAEVRPLDADRTATALWAMLNGLLALSWRADPLRVDETEQERLLLTALDVLQHGLQA